MQLRVIHGEEWFRTRRPVYGWGVTAWLASCMDTILPGSWIRTWVAIDMTYRALSRTGLRIPLCDVALSAIAPISRQI